MTLETGTKKDFLNQGKNFLLAFSLIEIVLVLALISVASTLFVLNLDSFVNRTGSLTANEVLAEGIRYARMEASKRQTITELMYDENSNSIIIFAHSLPIHKLKLGLAYSSSGSGTIEFNLVSPAEGFESFEFSRNDGPKLERVQFSPDRSSIPFIATIDDGINAPEKILFDPFSHFPRKTSP